MLLKHIVGTKAVRQRLDKGLFKETLVVFETENRKLMEKGVVSDSVAECDALCKVTSSYLNKNKLYCKSNS